MFPDTNTTDNKQNTVEDGRLRKLDASALIWAYLRHYMKT